MEKTLKKSEQCKGPVGTPSNEQTHTSWESQKEKREGKRHR